MASATTEVLTLGGVDAERLATAPFGILPVGSIEYHGPAAPFGTDTTLAVGFARRLAQERDGLVYPAVAYSFVPRLTRAFGPGVSVAPDVFLSYLTAVMHGIVAAGTRRLVVMNGHSENQYALRLAAENVSEAAEGVSVLLCNWWKLAPRGLFPDADGHGHGGPLEISTVAAFERAGVKVPADTTHDVPYEAPWWRQAAQVVGEGQAPAGFKGYHGAVSAIDVPKGEQIVAVVTAEMCRLVDDWLARAS